MAAPARRTRQSRFPDLFEWLESPMATLLPFGPAQTFRVEDYVQNGKYLIRAELPGLDPQKDIEVTADPGSLTIHAERREKSKGAHHSEFKYGSLTRSIGIPQSADLAKITAKYDQGILEVTVPVPEQGEETGRRIAVQAAGRSASTGS